MRLKIIFFSVFILCVVCSALFFTFRNDGLQVWAVFPVIVFFCTAGGLFLFVKCRNLAKEIVILHENLEKVRQHMGLLARHTRELRDAFVGVVRTDGSSDMNAREFASLSSIVSELASNMVELDKRIGLFEGELTSLHRSELLHSSNIAQSPISKNSPSVDVCNDETSVLKNNQPLSDSFSAFSPDFARSSSTLDVKSDSYSISSYADKIDEYDRDIDSGRTVRQSVAAAIASDRFELHLQRIVSLPQRHVRGYEVTLRPERSDFSVSWGEIRRAVEVLGHNMAFDQKLMFHAVRLAQAFSQRERGVTLFLELSPRFLMKEGVLSEIEVLVDGMRAITKQIVLVVPQKFLMNLSAQEAGILRRFCDLGFSFLMGEIETFDFDPQQQERIGVKWLRMPSKKFLNIVQSRETLFDVAVVDFASLMAKWNLTLMIDQVDLDEDVANLIDYDIKYAQGAAFALPQVVRFDSIDIAKETSVKKNNNEFSNAPQQKRGLRDLARRA